MGKGYGKGSVSSKKKPTIIRVRLGDLEGGVRREPSDEDKEEEPTNAKCKIKRKHCARDRTVISVEEAPE